MKWFDKKQKKVVTVDSGVVHNPKPTTERGKRRQAKRSEEDKVRASKAWGE